MRNNIILNYEDIKYYLKDIKNIPVITHERQKEIFKKLSSDETSEDEKDSLKKELVVGNLRFVITVAKTYQNRGIPIMDLISEGNIGLLKALDKFDYTTDVKFISYAVWWIKQSILLSLNEHSRTIRLPSNIIQTYQKDKKNNKNDTYLPYCIGLSDTINDDGDELIEIVRDPNEQTPDYENSKDEMKKCVDNVLNILTDRERTIIIKYYGLDGSEVSLKELGIMFDCTKERIRQLKDKAIKKLRNESYLLHKYI